MLKIVLDAHFYSRFVKYCFLFFRWSQLAKIYFIQGQVQETVFQRTFLEIHYSIIPKNRFWIYHRKLDFDWNCLKEVIDWQIHSMLWNLLTTQWQSLAYDLDHYTYQGIKHEVFLQAFCLDEPECSMLSSLIKLWTGKLTRYLNLDLELWISQCTSFQETWLHLVWKALLLKLFDHHSAW